MNAEPSPKYVGFWIRVIASLVDSLMVCIITTPLVLPFIDWSAALAGKQQETAAWVNYASWVLAALVIIGLWWWKSATPGKMLFRAVIVDATTGGTPTMKQWIVRYLGYYISLCPLGLGFFWIGWDRRKQGWHDKLANTVVVYEAAPVSTP